MIGIGANTTSRTDSEDPHVLCLIANTIRNQYIAIRHRHGWIPITGYSVIGVTGDKGRPRIRDLNLSGDRCLSV